MTGLTFAPSLPVWALIGLALVSVVAALLRARASMTGAILRLMAAAALIVFLAGPEIRITEGEPLSDIALVIVDQSRSMQAGGRDAIAASAAERLVSAIREEDVDVRTVDMDGEVETAFGEALRQGLSAVPRARLSSVIVLTDGQVTEVPDAGELNLDAPVHVLLAGDPADQSDRRVRTVRAPRYGVVGETVTIVFEVREEGRQESVPVTVSVGGEPVLQQSVEPNVEIEMAVPLTAPGETVIEVAVPTIPGELTNRNNRAAMRLTAIRDRLRVLLVSGEPHAGERVWRNILKSDPAVDLVHFTILKPFEKDAVAPTRELNLIEFPHQELFLDKLSEFDVVIFDRYTYRGVLQPYEFERVAAYVRAGGAVLVSAGPELAGRDSLAAQRSLAQILPVRPAAEAIETAFVPTLTTTGQRHPVTTSLDEEPWGRWLRYLPVSVTEGETVLQGPGEAPLLVLSRVGEGRVAVLTSDHVWLWSRGFDGGGPHRELLRRLVHWLMQEPALEEEALSGRVTPQGELVVTRRSLEDAPAPIRIERPDETTTRTELVQISAGLFEATLPVDQSGLYRLRSDTADGLPLFAVAASGEGQVAELAEMLTTPGPLTPLADQTDGTIAMLADSDARLPSIRRVREGASAGGRGWIGLVRRDAEAVSAVRAETLLPRWAWLLLGLGAATGAWLAEGRRR